MPPPRVESILRARLAERGIGPEDSILIAYSGGPDSTALLAAASRLGYSRVSALHVDHGLRSEEELAAELELVVANCRRLGLPLSVARVRRGAIAEAAASRGLGIEAAARDYRYAALRRAAEARGGATILLAHTRDDQAETVLMRLLGGSGAGGLRGIPESSGLYLRPFIGLGKAELLAYLEERGLPYSSDSTNASLDYRRNRVRNRLIPLLDEEFPGWRRGIAKTAAKSELDEEALSKAAAALAFAPYHESKEGTEGKRQAEPALAASAELLSAPDAVAARAIVAAGGALLGRDRFSYGLALAALAALRRGEGASYSGGGIELSAACDSLIMRRGLDFQRRGGYFVLIDRPRRVRAGSIVVSAFWRSGEASGLRPDSFSFPLVVRSRRPGDSIAIGRGAKRLDELFSEWGLSESLRELVPIVEDRRGIVAVLGARLGARDRYRYIASGDPGGKRLSVIVKGA